MAQILIHKTDQAKPKPPAPIDTRSPSGKRLPW
jgi:hypothetical protein